VRQVLTASDAPTLDTAWRTLKRNTLAMAAVCDCGFDEAHNLRRR
jgi:hypothetical protein